MKKYLLILLFLAPFSPARAQSGVAADSTPPTAILIDAGLLNEVQGRSGVDLFALGVTHQIPIMVDYIYATSGKIVTSSTSGFMSYSETSVPETERSALTISTGWSYKSSRVLFIAMLGVSYETIVQRRMLSASSTTTGWLFTTTTYHAEVGASSTSDIAFNPSLGMFLPISRVFGFSALYGKSVAPGRAPITDLRFGLSIGRQP